jgi:ABC-type transport system involved in cytochrome bd biosynthesis fused ATPase/permease subunit
MKITEIENKDLQVKKVEMDCDKCIKDKKGRSIALPLMNTSHFYIINGASGMGKSNLIVSLLKSQKITKDKKAKLSYRKMFDKVIFVSPSAATIKDSPLEKIADDQKFNELNSEVFDLLEDIGEDAVEDNKHNLLILDDVSSQLRSRENEKILNQTIKNRRHKNLSVWIVGHKITDLAPSLRSNANMIFLFKPKTNKEVNAIQEEYMLMPKKQADEIFAATYKSRYDFLLIDTSLRTSADFRFFRNYNELIFEEEDKNENKD